MREIIFRGLRTDGKGWVYGSLILPNTENENTYIQDNNGASRKVRPESVCQYTGLKDRNGKDIYEGDICSGHSDGNGVITWEDFDGGYDYVFEDEANVGIWEVKRNIEIIGNIHTQK